MRVVTVNFGFFSLEIFRGFQLKAFDFDEIFGILKVSGILGIL